MSGGGWYLCDGHLSTITSDASPAQQCRPACLHEHAPPSALSTRSTLLTPRATECLHVVKTCVLRFAIAKISLEFIFSLRDIVNERLYRMVGDGGLSTHINHSN